jgi:hypothetical protein
MLLVLFGLAAVIQVALAVTARDAASVLPHAWAAAGSLSGAAGGAVRVWRHARKRRPDDR